MSCMSRLKINKEKSVKYAELSMLLRFDLFYLVFNTFYERNLINMLNEFIFY